jgi:hypothetical protein
LEPIMFGEQTIFDGRPLSILNERFRSILIWEGRWEDGAEWRYRLQSSPREL